MCQAAPLDLRDELLADTSTTPDIDLTQAESVPKDSKRATDGGVVHPDRVTSLTHRGLMSPAMRPVGSDTHL